MKKIALFATALAFVGHAIAATPISAVAATPIPINSVPKTISNPGSYVVTANLICTAGVPAITINSPKAGKIVLDLGGFTLAASGVNIPGVYYPESDELLDPCEKRQSEQLSNRHTGQLWGNNLGYRNPN
jgi:hypothetical protein